MKNNWEEEWNKLMDDIDAYCASHSVSPFREKGEQLLRTHLISRSLIREEIEKLKLENTKSEPESYLEEIDERAYNAALNHLSHALGLDK